MTFIIPTGIIYGTSDVGVIPLAEAMIARGIRPLFLVNISIYEADIRASIQSYDYVHVPSLERTLQLLDSLLAQRKVICVISTQDEFLSEAIILASKLGVQGLDSAGVFVNDKSYLFEICPEFLPQQVKILSKNDVIDAFAEVFHDTPCVLKPSVGSDSKGLRFVDKQTCRDLSEIDESYILQQRLVGREFSAEGFVQNGKVYILGFSSITKVGLTESRNIFPINEDLTDDIKENCQLALESICIKSNYKNGYFHSQFIAPEGGAPKLIDPNFGRMGGAGFGSIISIALGISMQEFYDKFLALLLGETISFQSAGKIRALAISYGVDCQGIFRGVNFKKSQGVQHFVLKDPGVTIGNIKNGSINCIGILTGQEENILSSIDSFRILINDQWVPASF